MNEKAESKHTPGPWVVFPEYKSEIQTQEGKVIASCWYEYAAGPSITVTDVTEEESAANAILMAAAPDLLAVAEGYEAWEADLITDGNWERETPTMTQAQFDRLVELQAMRNAAIAKAKGGAK